MYFPRKSIIFVVFSIAFFLAFSANLWAVALSPEVVQKLRQEGRLQEWIDRWEMTAANGMYDLTPNTPLHIGEKGTNTVDTILKPIVICVDFSNRVHTYSIGKFDTLLFSKGYVVPTGSFRDYYWEVSYGKHDPAGGVVSQWVRAPHPDSFYTNGTSGLTPSPYPNNGQGLAYDALIAANNAGVNFANYDYDNDGWVDGVIIVHAGPGAEETGSDWDMWSHRWSLPTVLTLDGKKIQDYTMQPEMHVGGGLITIGVFCHEWGHFLGMHWEEYDPDYTSNGLGNWSVMAAGSYNNNGSTPAHHSAYCKSFLGWTSVTTVSTNRINQEILQAETSPLSYRLWTSGSGGSQYFMVENRQKTKFDSFLPGEGLMVYYVDVGMGDNGNKYEWCPGDAASPHYRNALEQADGFRSLEGCNGLNEGDGNDPFPGFIDKTAFDDTTSPNSHNYSGVSTQVAVWNISDSDSIMHANLDVTWSRPNLYLMSFTISDAPPGGNGNGRAEGGETCKLYFSLKNTWLPITNTTVTGSVDTAGIPFSDNISYFTSIGTGVTVNNNSDPMQFTVDPNFPGKPVIFTLHAVGNSGTYSIDFHREVWVGNAEILIVDDDTGSVADYRSYYTSALDSLRTIYDIWPSRISPNITFNKYKYLIWFTGDHKTDLFSQAQVESLMSFLDKGGRLFLTSQDAAEVLSASSDPWDTLFLRHYLHVGYDGDNLKHLAVGRSGDEISDSMFIYPNYTVTNQTSKDNLVPDADAEAILYYPVEGSGMWCIPSDSVAGIKYSGDFFKVVLFGFGFESIKDDGGYFQCEYTSTPRYIMQRVLDWLKAPLPSLILTSPNGGEEWFIGCTTTDILWQSIAVDNKIKIELTTDAGTSWITIADSAANVGTFTLEVPNTPSNSCMVKITDVDNYPSDVSDGFFTITNHVWGDASGNKVVDVGDVIYLINYLFKGGLVPNPKCAGDPSGNCVIDVGDVIYVINYLFKSGPPPLAGCV